MTGPRVRPVPQPPQGIAQQEIADPPKLAWWVCPPDQFYAQAKIENLRIKATDRSRATFKDITQ